MGKFRRPIKQVNSGATEGIPLGSSGTHVEHKPQRPAKVEGAEVVGGGLPWGYGPELLACPCLQAEWREPGAESGVWCSEACPPAWTRAGAGRTCLLPQPAPSRCSSP